MSAKLDKSLDELLSSRRRTARRGAGRRSTISKAGTASTPVGGVKKSTKPAKTAGKGAQPGPSSAPKESKIIVSGLVSFPFAHPTDQPTFHVANFHSLPM